MAEIVSAGFIRETTDRIDHQQEVVDREKAGLKAILEGADEVGLRKDAYKSALKLRKLKPHKRRAWLHTFHATIDALGLDSQLDLEDAIDAMDRSAGDVETTLSTVDPQTGEVEEISRFGKAARKARGRPRQTAH